MKLVRNTAKVRMPYKLEVLFMSIKCPKCGNLHLVPHFPKEVSIALALFSNVQLATIYGSIGIHILGKYISLL